ncbi:hypothetical protein AbraIFM66950_001991 [Aspergillus brasiliensis]|nr:hypothetical protein AbraIFM66950_001991 [Aspergillus brasiliensis]
MDPSKSQTNTSQFKNIPEDEFIQLTSYHRRDFDLAVIRINPRDHKHVRKSLTQTLEAPSSSLGQLDILHLELIHEICVHLDIESLFRFRQASRLAHQCVSTSRFYRETTTHALDALCILQRTKLAKQFTLPELFTAICTRDCQLCSSFGGFLFLPTLLRCCFSCIHLNRLPELVPFTDAKWYVSSKAKTLSKLSSLANFHPTLRTLPGIYSMREVPIKGRRELVTMDEIIRTVGSRPTPDEQGVWTSARSYSNLPFMATTALPWFNRVKGRLEEGVCCSGCQVSLEEYFMGGSDSLPDILALRERVYSQDEFIAHFGQCRKAQEVWHLRKHGTSVEGVSEFVSRRGYFNQRDVVMSFNRF